MSECTEASAKARAQVCQTFGSQQAIFGNVAIRYT